MPNDVQDLHSDASPLVFSWGIPGSDAQQRPIETATLWLAGGLVLCLWTGLAMLMTTA